MSMFAMLMTIIMFETSTDSIHERLDNEDLKDGIAHIGAEAVHLMRRISPFEDVVMPMNIIEEEVD